MPGVGGASELLADQPRQLQQCGPGPVVGHDVLRLPGGVAGDQDNVADLTATLRTPGRSLADQGSAKVGLTASISPPGIAGNRPGMRAGNYSKPGS